MYSRDYISELKKIKIFTKLRKQVEMVRTKYIGLRLHRDEFDNLSKDALSRGHTTISSYLRTLVNKEKWMREMIAETNVIMKKMRDDINNIKEKVGL